MIAGPNSIRGAAGYYATEQQVGRRLNVQAMRPTTNTTRPARTVSTSTASGKRNPTPPDVPAITKDARGKNARSIEIIRQPRPIVYPMPKNPGAGASMAERRRYFAALIQHHRAKAADLGWLVNYWLVKRQHLEFWQRQHTATLAKLKKRAGVAGLGDFEQQRATIAKIVAQQNEYRQKIDASKKLAAAARAANQRMTAQIKALQRRLAA